MQRIEIRKGEMRLYMLGIELLGTVMLVDRYRPDQQHQESDGYRGGDGPIAVAEKLIPQDAPDHEIVGSAEQCGNHEFADGWDEHQHGAGDDSWHGQRKRNIEKGPP